MYIDETTADFVPLIKSTKNISNISNILEVPKVKVLIMPFQKKYMIIFLIIKFFDYIYWCIHVFIALMLQLVKVEVI